MANNTVSSNIYLSANVAVFVLGNLFWANYRHKSLKYGLIKYPACVIFTATGKCIPLRTFLCIIFDILSILT